MTEKQHDGFYDGHHATGIPRITRLLNVLVKAVKLISDCVGLHEDRVGFTQEQIKEWNQSRIASLIYVGFVIPSTSRDVVLFQDATVVMMDVILTRSIAAMWHLGIVSVSVVLAACPLMPNLWDVA
jgi:hypothetical protein